MAVGTHQAEARPVAVTKLYVGGSRQVDKQIVGVGPLRHRAPCHDISLDVRVMAPRDAARHLQPCGRRDSVRISGEQQQCVAGMGEQFTQPDCTGASGEVGVADPVSDLRR